VVTDRWKGRRLFRVGGQSVEMQPNYGIVCDWATTNGSAGMVARMVAQMVAGGKEVTDSVLPSGTSFTDSSLLREALMKFVAEAEKEAKGG
jgi:hypothetical protein